MSRSDAVPNPNAISGTLFPADVGLLTNNALGANVSVVNRDYRLPTRTHNTQRRKKTPEKLIGLSLFDLHDDAQMRELEPHFQRLLAGEAAWRSHEATYRA